MSEQNEREIQSTKAMVITQLFHLLLKDGGCTIKTDDAVKFALYLGTAQLLKEYADEFIPESESERDDE